MMIALEILFITCTCSSTIVSVGIRYVTAYNLQQRDVPRTNLFTFCAARWTGIIQNIPSVGSFKVGTVLVSGR